MKIKKIEKTIVYNYQNDAKLSAVYHPEKLGGHNDADRIELIFDMQNGERVEVLMTLVEAIHVINSVSYVMDAMMDHYRREATIPLYAK